MQINGAPSKISTPFANNGDKNIIPVPASSTPGAASYSAGFPTETRIPVDQGGAPPSGLDFNGIFNAISALSRWYAAGGSFPYDSAFATAIGGYPQGARLLRADGAGYWRSTVDNNTSNPDTGGAGWAVEGYSAVANVYVGNNANLIAGTTKVPFNSVEFDSKGLWDSNNSRYKAIFNGLYRFSGTLTIVTPQAQVMSIYIYKNGNIARFAGATTQVSDQNLNLSWDTIISLNVGDYVEISVTSISGVTVAGGFVPNYSQCEYLGQA